MKVFGQNVFENSRRYFLVKVFGQNVLGNSRWYFLGTLRGHDRLGEWSQILMEIWQILSLFGIRLKTLKKKRKSYKHCRVFIGNSEDDTWFRLKILYNSTLFFFLSMYISTLVAMDTKKEKNQKQKFERKLIKLQMKRIEILIQRMVKLLKLKVVESDIPSSTRRIMIHLL